MSAGEPGADRVTPVMQRANAAGERSVGIVLARWEVADSDGAAPGRELPTQLGEVRRLRANEVVRARSVEFGMAMRPGGPAFLIDGKTFDADRTDSTVRLGTVEDWTIRNTTPMDHPFHLHTWPFQVVGDSTPRWQDVVNVPAGGEVTVRIQFLDFPGRSVHHCHILDHEDLGMMAVVRAEGGTSPDR